MDAVLEHTIAEFSARLSRVEVAQHAVSLIVPIDSLAPATLEIIAPFHVVVQPYEDEFVATFFDANISATGDTQQEAVENVKDMVVDLFEFLDGQPSRGLGAAMQRQQNVLRAVLKRRA
jgi:hypothetical protein